MMSNKRVSILHRRFFSAVAVIATSSFLFSACGTSDPLVLSLKSSQVTSGSNRASPISAQYEEDAKLAYAQNVSYSALNELPDLGESAEAWSVNPLKENIGTLRKLAVSLGLSGDVVKEEQLLNRAR
jgi:hypothetical protein